MLTKDEFFDVYRVFLPAADREAFERDWAEFEAFKAAHEARGKVQ
jgi:hypothetical protein